MIDEWYSRPVALAYRVGKFVTRTIFRIPDFRFCSLYQFTLDLTDPIARERMERNAAKQGLNPAMVVGGDNIEAFNESMSKKYGHIYFAFDEAYVQEIERTLPFDGAYIYKLFVDPSVRNMGLGKKMVSAMVEESDRLSNGTVEKVHALVEIDNFPSQRVFIGLGFAPVKQLFYLRIGQRIRFREMDISEGRGTASSPEKEIKSTI